MTYGKVNRLMVVAILVVAAAEFAACKGLKRSRRQTPPLPAALPPVMGTAPRLPPRANMWSCCPRVPMVLKSESKVGCMPVPVRPAMPMLGGPMPLGAPTGGPMPMPTGSPLPGGALIPGGVTPGIPMPRPGMTPRNNPGNYSCFVECAYKSQSLVSGGVLSVAAVKARLTELANANSAWTEVLNAAAQACTASAPVVGTNAPCKSGAAEINGCISNYILKNCPMSVRVESASCTELRRNIMIPQWG